MKGVEIGAKTDRALSRPLALQGSDDARLGDSIRDFDAPCAQVIGDNLRGPHFLESGFGMLVDVVTDLDELRLVALELADDFGPLHLHLLRTPRRLTIF